MMTGFMIRTLSQTMSAFGVKQTSPPHCKMSAYDPKRTCERSVDGFYKTRLANMVEHEEVDDEIDYEN